MTNVPVPPSLTLEQLIAKWQKEAKLQRDAIVHSSYANAKDECADELSEVLSALQSAEHRQEAEVEKLRNELRTAQDEAQENWQSVKKWKALAESAEHRGRGEWLREIRAALTACPIVSVDREKHPTGDLLGMRRSDAARAIKAFEDRLHSRVEQEPEKDSLHDKS